MRAKVSRSYVQNLLIRFFSGLDPDDLDEEDEELLGPHPEDEKARKQLEISKIVAAVDVSPWRMKHTVFFLALMVALGLDFAKPLTIGLCIPGMKSLWHLGESVASIIATMGILGTLFGSVLCGYAADRWGRRPILLITMITFSLASLGGLSTNVYQVFLASFVMGLGIGGETSLSFAMACEYTPARLRGKTIISLGFIASVVGYIIAGLTATISKLTWDSEFAWRPQLLSGFVPAALIFLLRAKVLPESARYLIVKGKITAARSAAQSIVGNIDAVIQNYTKDHPDYEVPDVSTAPPPIETVVASKKKLFKRTMGMGSVIFCFGVVSASYHVWIPTLIELLGFEPWQAALYVTLSAVFTLPGFPLTMKLFASWSRRWMLVLFLALFSLSLMIQGIGDKVGAANGVFVVILNVGSLYCLISISGAFPSYVAELFPTRERAKRGGIVSGFGKVGALIGTFASGAWLESGGEVIWMFCVYAALMVLASIVLWIVGIETEGKTLEDIELDSKEPK